MTHETEVTKKRCYRHDGNDLMYPTESEFAQFVMDRYRDDGLVALDSHWIPIWTKQPFCRVKFDFIGKMESFDRDRDYILRQIGAEVFSLLIERSQSGSIFNV